MDSGIDSDEPNVDATPRDQPSQATIGYRKLRSPSLHGRSLQIPPLRSVDQVWQTNLQIRSDMSCLRIADVRLSDLQKLGRAELIKLATGYTSRYLDVEFDLTSDNLVMAGHQPELFHPGVWYKNFVLSNLGQKFNCAAINLVVDNDVCDSASIRFPEISEADAQTNVSLGTIPLDAVGPNVPYESREIQDWTRFEGFADRAEIAIGKTVSSPIVSELWPHVVDAAMKTSGAQLGRLGHAIAAGRHLLEGRVGLRTLEVPISWVAHSEVFAIFAKSILINATRFQQIFNEALFEYRNVHGIRSRSHPVPELETINSWVEAPFWVWQKDQPTRRRLFTKKIGQSIVLSDLTGWERTVKSDAFVTGFRSIEKEGVSIRPKALMTTMFSRLILCDLFLHGIGGAKYDQLTDAIAERFYLTRLPGFLTLTATMKLPMDGELVSRSDVVAIDQQIRELKFHPESHISNPSNDVSELIRQKHDWTIGSHLGERSKEKHLAIEKINQRLAQFVDVDPASLLTARAESVAQIRASQILGSREYSFCLFPDSLIGELKALAKINV